MVARVGVQRLFLRGEGIEQCESRIAAATRRHARNAARPVEQLLTC
jgi:hypothetical protein